MDAVGSAIRVDSRGREVMRIMPRVNDQVNEEWISDKTRYCVDGLKTQRLDRPYLRIEGRLVEASWQRAFAAIAGRIAATSGERIGAVAGDLASVEDMFALKLLMQSLGSKNIDCRQDGAALDPSLGRGGYLFNSTVLGIERADAILIIGSNPRREAPVLNARIRKRWRLAGIPIAVIGEQADLTYTYEHLGAGPDSLSRLVAGEGGFLDKLKAAKRPLIVVGQGALTGVNGSAVLSAAAKLALDIGAIADDWMGLSILHTAASRVGGLDIGFVPGEGGFSARDIDKAGERLGILFLRGADEIDVPPGPFVV
jgi:NADH-quinone oxidoreductase subunit G